MGDLKVPTEEISRKQVCNMNLILLGVLVVVVALRNVEGKYGCDSALVKAVDCKDRAMAAYESEQVELLAKRNCRFISSLKTCRDELKAVCPSMMRFWTTMNLDILNKFQGTNMDWDRKKCPRTMYDEQTELEAETEKDDTDKMRKKDDDDKMRGKKSGQIKQTPLFGFVLMALLA